jgi:hypothetical protein
VTPQKTKHNIIEDLMEIGRHESLVADHRKIIVRMFSELKEEVR